MVLIICEDVWLLMSSIKIDSKLKLSFMASLMASELRQCVELVELSLEHNKLVWPLLDFSWHNDVFVVAEPGELAEKFLQSVKFSLLSTMRSHRRKSASLLANVSTISDLVAFKPYFQIGGIVHRYLGRQTLVMEDNQEIGLYMIRRTVPSMQFIS
ncbi:hypothetical protein P8452_77191 [Trifolium repens]|nr:hypothetical protein P8452_77191 [Trifolium repens]